MKAKLFFHSNTDVKFETFQQTKDITVSQRNKSEIRGGN